MRKSCATRWLDLCGYPIFFTNKAMNLSRTFEQIARMHLMCSWTMSDWLAGQQFHVAKKIIGSSHAKKFRNQKLRSVILMIVIETLDRLPRASENIHYR